MKILELEINNIRGIRHLKLEQEEKNFVIYGPNGSGKSAVVDSLDFLLTGNISRLTGEGTGDINLKKHGSHINVDPENATVRALIKVPLQDDAIELTRCMVEPKKLIYDDSLKESLEPILRLAEQRQYILTRRDILRYITTNPSTRAKQIQDLLNIQNIEKIRKNFVTIRNRFKSEFESIEGSFNELKGLIVSSIPIDRFSEELVLEHINRNRKMLGGSALSDLTCENLKVGISTMPTSTILTDNDLKIFDVANQTISKLVSAANLDRIGRIEAKLRNLIERVKDNPQLLNNLSRFKLTEIGLSLIDETGDCPLCDTAWESGELELHLRNKISSIKEVENLMKEIRNLSDGLKSDVKTVSNNIRNILRIAQMAEIKDISLIRHWDHELNEFFKVLNNPVDLYLESKFMPHLIKKLLMPEDIFEILHIYSQSIQNKVVKLTPEQSAWDNLTRLEEHLKSYEKRKISVKLTLDSLNKAEKLLQCFLDSRDKILGDLYKKIKNRFVDLYKELHGTDEEDFTAKLEPDEAGLYFEVDFHGKGTHPPHALHSEGHQDSMGLCLYLALAEEINENLINFIVLDDVVMSVDSDHRKVLCKILSKNFPNWQFFITTHDKTWTNQLRSEGVVRSKNLIEFYNWNLETGPMYMDYKINIWEQIYETLSKGDIPNAAFQLRRGLEQFFGIVCNDLQAPVPYKLSGRYELGDFLKAAVKIYKSLLKKAINSASTWDNHEKVEELKAYETEVNQIYTRTNVEHWAVNASVHFNTWSELTENDFRPVVEAFTDLYQLFLCSNCGGIKQVLKDSSLRETTVTCKCGEFNWILVRK